MIFSEILLILAVFLQFQFNRNLIFLSIADDRVVGIVFSPQLCESRCFWQHHYLFTADYSKNEILGYMSIESINGIPMEPCYLFQIHKKNENLLSSMIKLETVQIIFPTLEHGTIIDNMRLTCYHGGAVFQKIKLYPYKINEFFFKTFESLSKTKKIYQLQMFKIL